MEKEIYKIYSDGACEPNPGVGGYCGIIIKNSDMTPWVIIKGGCKHTTNNRMEIMGVLSALRYIKNSSFIIVISDSQYVCNSINMWLKSWIYKEKNKKNMDLWKEMWQLKQKHDIRAKWIRGHNGNLYNEYADSISMECIDKIRRSRKKEFNKINFFGK